MIEQEKVNDQNQNEYYLQQDDEYGLPEAEYAPLEQGSASLGEEEHFTPKREIDLQPKSERSYAGIIVAAILLLAVAGFAVYYFVFNKPETITPQIAVQAPAPQPEPTPEVTEEAPAEPWTPPVAKEGSITTITEKTGRYFIILGSFIDGDLAGDYAKKLAKEGKEVTLIEPTGGRKFYRLGIDGGETFATANTELDNLKSTFGQEIWLVRY